MNLEPIVAALGASLVTAFGYTLAFSNKLSTLESKVNLLLKRDNQQDELAKDVNQLCEKHSGLDKRICRIEAQIDK